MSAIEQPDFFNAAATASTRLKPEELLAVLKQCERLFGRRRGQRWGPRPLDLDLLIFGPMVMTRPEICIPHPRLRERRFYLEPLAEIAPDLGVPPDGVAVKELLATIAGSEPPSASLR